MRRAREEKAIVLDFLKHGYPDDSRPFHQKEAIIQAIGKDHFVLLELVPQDKIEIKPGDEVYIGDGEREQIKFIKGVIRLNKLTQTAKNELPFIVEQKVTEYEERFVEFFNRAGPISLRAHSLELLPNIGKRHSKDILEAREERPFVSFDDIKMRVKSIPDPKKLVIQRIMGELDELDRYNLFVGV